MNAEQLIAKAKTQYSLADVQNKSVEAVSVLDLEELAQLVERAVRERTAELHDELAKLSSSGGDALEAEAAAAALEAEAVALEAKAEAEQRAAAAESELRKLKDELAAQAGGGGGASSEELEAAQARARELEGQLAALEEEKRGLADRIADLERAHADAKGDLEAKLADMEEQLAKARESGGGGGGDDEPLEPVTEADLKQAKRLAMAFLEDVFMDDEEKSNQAIAAGNVPKVFEKELGDAFRKYVKRVKPAVRAEAGVWEETLAACLKKTW